MDVVIHIEKFDMMTFGASQQQQYTRDLTRSVPGISKVKGKVYESNLSVVLDDVQREPPLQ